MQAVRGTGRAPSAVGVAVPGILDPAGHVSRSLAAPALEGVDLAGALAERLGCPVEVDNDIKLAALAEHHLGPAADSIVLLQLGHRVSVAVIVGGAILQGAHRLAGELGSQRGMRWTDSSVRGRLTWSTGDDAQELLERAAAGDPGAVQEVEEFCAQIAPRLATVLLTVDPERVVVGGGLSRAGETLLAPLRRAVGRLLMTEHAPRWCLPGSPPTAPSWRARPGFRARLRPPHRRPRRPRPGIASMPPVLTAHHRSRRTPP